MNESQLLSHMEQMEAFRSEFSNYWNYEIYPKLTATLPPYSKSQIDFMWAEEWKRFVKRRASKSVAH